MDRNTRLRIARLLAAASLAMGGRVLRWPTAVAATAATAA